MRTSDRVGGHDRCRLQASLSHQGRPPRQGRRAVTSAHLGLSLIGGRAFRVPSRAIWHARILAGPPTPVSGSSHLGHGNMRASVLPKAARREGLRQSHPHARPLASAGNARQALRRSHPHGRKAGPMPWSYPRAQGRLRGNRPWLCRHQRLGVARAAAGFGENGAFVKVQVNICDIPIALSWETHPPRTHTYRYRPRSFMRRQKRTIVFNSENRCGYSCDR